MSTTGSAAATRLYHLDALRSAAILFGVLVHTATLGVSWPLTLVSDVSGYFRMGTFFLVSGFFGAMVLKRTGWATFLRRRILALGLPFLCGVVLLNPLTTWLIWRWHNEQALPFLEFLDRAWWSILPSRDGPVIWHLHLWFLICLLFYAALAPVFVWLVRLRPKLPTALANMLASLPGWLCVFVISTIIALSSLGLRALYEVGLEQIVPRNGWNVPWLVRTTLYYLPMFLTGMALFHHPRFCERFQTISWPGLAFAVGVVIASRQFMIPEGFFWEATQLLARAFLTTCMTAALMALFGRWFAAPSLLSRSADAVYSIYILHFLVIYVIAWALRPLNLSQTGLFMVVVPPTIGVLFAVHNYIIRPSALLSLLFNGKAFPRRLAKAGTETRQP